MVLACLACPFRHPDTKIRKKRCAAAHYAAAELSKQGYHVFSPLTHNHILVDLAPELPGEHWMQFDLTILSFCKTLFVLKLDGWETSRGVQQEIQFAKEKGMKIIELNAPPEEKYLHLIKESK